MLKILIVAGLIFLGYSEGRTSANYENARRELEQLKRDEKE